MTALAGFIAARAAGDDQASPKAATVAASVKVAFIRFLSRQVQRKMYAEPVARRYCGLTHSWLFAPL